MKVYRILAKVEQIVSKEVNVLIEGNNKAEVEDKVKALLRVYPDPLPYDPMIHRVVTAKSKHSEPQSIKISKIELEPDEEIN